MVDGGERAARESTQLRGKTAVVTGSSSGVGRAIALELAASGAHVLVHARTSADAAYAVTEQIRKLGCEADFVLCDLIEPQRHAELIEKAWNWRRGVDIWVNNAGATVLTGEAAGWTFDRKLELLWTVDVRATLRLSRLIGERMKQRFTLPGAGVILNMGWDQAAYGMEGDSGQLFGAVKGAIMAFTRSLAKSLAPQVRVNCLAPGWIKTAWGDQASEYWQQRAKKESLLGRWGTPEDVAQVAAFLASSAASFITGQVININGGFRALTD